MTNKTLAVLARALAETEEEFDTLTLCCLRGRLASISQDLTALAVAEQFDHVEKKQAEAEKAAPCSPWWSPDEKMMADMGYDTIAGFMGRRGLIEGTPDDLLGEDQRRHAFALVHETARKGFEVIKVVAPNCLRMISLPDGGWINTVNAYPVELIEQRMREKGII